MDNTTLANDPCLDCGRATMGILTTDDGTTYGIGINRLAYDDGERNGWLCADCAGYECNACGKIVPLDEDITIVNDEGHNEKYHWLCLSANNYKRAIEQGEISE